MQVSECLVGISSSLATAGRLVSCVLWPVWTNLFVFIILFHRIPLRSSYIPKSNFGMSLNSEIDKRQERTIIKLVQHCPLVLEIAKVLVINWSIWIFHQFSLYWLMFPKVLWTMLASNKLQVIYPRHFHRPSWSWKIFSSYYFVCLIYPYEDWDKLDLNFRVRLHLLRGLGYNVKINDGSRKQMIF